MSAPSGNQSVLNSTLQLRKSKNAPPPHTHTHTLTIQPAGGKRQDIVISIIQPQVNMSESAEKGEGDEGAWALISTPNTLPSQNPAGGGERRRVPTPASLWWRLWQGARVVCSGFGSSKPHNQKAHGRADPLPQGRGSCGSNSCQAAAGRRYSYIHIRLPCPQWSPLSNGLCTSPYTPI